VILGTDGCAVVYELAAETDGLIALGNGGGGGCNQWQRLGSSVE
jgi:hypothetical protein